MSDEKQHSDVEAIDEPERDESLGEALADTDDSADQPDADTAEKPTEDDALEAAVADDADDDESDEDEAETDEADEAPAGAVADDDDAETTGDANAEAESVPADAADDSPATPEEWPVPREELRQIIEGVLFVSGRVITLNAMQSAIPDAPMAQIKTVIEEMVEHYSTPALGFHLVEVNNGYQFRSDPICSNAVREMLKSRPTRLSRAALESLAIIAYRQPVTRADIEEIRGVDAGGVLKTLLDKKLVRILGKREEPGRPLIYGTTKDFLETFNLRSLKDLPTLQEFQELTEEHRAKVDTTFSRDEVAKAEEEQDNLFVPPDRHADESSSARELVAAAEDLEMAVRSAEEKVEEALNRVPYDQQTPDDLGDDDDEPVADVEVISAPREFDFQSSPPAQPADTIPELVEGPDSDPEPPPLTPEAEAEDAAEEAAKKNSEEHQ